MGWIKKIWENGVTQANAANLNNIETGIQEAAAAAVSAAANSVTLAGNQTIGGTKNFTSPPTVPAPTALTDAVNLEYMQGLFEGITTTPNVLLAATAALPTNTYVAGVLTGVALGALEIDGEAAPLGARVHVTEEANKVHNGIYVVTHAGGVAEAYVLTRWSGMADGAEVKAGLVTYAEAGATRANKAYWIVGDGPFTVGTSELVYEPFLGGSAIPPNVARTGTDGTVGGPAGSPLSPSVVSGSTNVLYADTYYNSVIYASNSAALQAAIAAATSTGPARIVFTPGKTYTLDTAPLSLARNLVGLEIDLNGATIRLSGEAKQLTVFNKIANHDLFSNITIHGGTIDNNNIGGLGHVVMGTVSTTGSALSKVSFNGLWLHHLKVINVPSAITGENYNTAILHRLNVQLQGAQPAANEATQDYITNCVVEDCRFEGGNGGVYIGAAGISTVGLNVYISGNRVSRVYHNTGGVAFGASTTATTENGSPTLTTVASFTHIVIGQEITGTNIQAETRVLATNPGAATITLSKNATASASVTITTSGFFSSSNIQIGGRGFGGKNLIEDCEGYGSGDVGIEIDSQETTEVIGCKVQDPYNHCYYVANFNYPNLSTTSGGPTESINTLATQEIIFDRCQARRILSATCNGFHCALQIIGLGSVKLKACSWFRKTEDIGSNGEGVSCVVTMNELSIENFQGIVEGINIPSSAGQQTQSIIMVTSTSGPRVFRARGVRCSFNGTNASASSQTLRGIDVGGTTGHPVTTVDIDDVTLEGTLTGWAGGIFGVLIGNNSATVKGVVEGVKWNNISGFPGASNLVFIGGKSTLTIPPQARVLITGCDASAGPFPGGGAANCIVYGSSGGSNAVQAPRVYNAYRNSSPLDPNAVPVVITPAASEAYKRNEQGCDGVMVISGGTVTAIELSADGSTAQPTGQTAGAFVVPNGGYWRWNGSVAPTQCVFLPINP